ncbi:MAG TPA: hypothetical protein DDZ80_10155 [Cyanobacteria bacterium UBA8803]|nr:hypothetical protein [Cyanobacteria bacterium UBA9273]HBL58854.1 hypothetical protein [Cyanobacteria bacterium UBA8803]
MIPVLNSLEHISSGYSIFEKDQVLTHEQLNSITAYLDDQTRLTRVKLLGVGIACGLRVSLQDNSVKITQGVGITTDGDLLYFNNDTIFNRFKIYDKSYPAYPPFYVNGDVDGEMIVVYQLAASDDERAILLSEFNTQTGKNLNNMVAVLLMESYEKDDDICSGTDCDNLGKDRINTIKLLLVENQSLGLLKPAIFTPDQAAKSLNEIVADRAIIPSSLKTLNELTQTYRDTCNGIHNQLIGELPKLYPNCRAFLADIFPADPTNSWLTSLVDLNRTFSTTNSGIQYYYDFLKDVVETYNACRELLFDDATLFYTNRKSYSKHLLLGNLMPGTDINENRTGFYPSPIVSQTTDQLNHAKFLVQKLNALIQTFQNPIPVGNNLTRVAPTIRITPSLGEDQPLAERAIPYYYQRNATLPIGKSWNYRLSRRGVDIYSYFDNKSTVYEAQTDTVTKQIATQIGRFSFFRIEGHLGRNVLTVEKGIKSLIKANNLPFAVRSVMIGTDKNQLVKPPIRYSDLHRLHHLLRQDVANQLEEVIGFSQNFKQKVDAAVKNRVVTDAPEGEGLNFQNIAKDKNSTVARNATSARSVLRMNYTQYQGNATWQNNLTQAIQAASEFKYNLSDVVKTEFNTPFDTLVSNTHLQWIDLLDQIIAAKDEKEDDKLLFNNFIEQHPGIEHFGGVGRGGTFLLVYDTNKTVVADFMLPYYCPDPVESPAPEPTLKKPVLKPRWVIQNGLQVVPSIERKFDKFKVEKLADFVKAGQLGDFVKTTQLSGLVKSQLDDFKFEQLDKIQTQFQVQFDNQQDKYFNVLQNSVEVLGNKIGQLDKLNLTGIGRVTEPSTAQLRDRVKNLQSQRQTVDLLNQNARKPGLTEDARQTFAEQAKLAEAELAKSIRETTEYIAASGWDVSKGSEGFNAMSEVSRSMAAFTNNETLAVARNGLGEVAGKTNNAELKLSILKMQIENTRSL